MKTKTSLLIVLALISLLAAACGTPPAAAPTTQPPAVGVQAAALTPTMTGSPIPAAAQTGVVNVVTVTLPTPVASGLTIRMSAGDKCTLEGPQSIPAGRAIVQWIVESKEHDRYGLAMAGLDPGKTIEDARALPPTYLEPPSFAHWYGDFFEAEPGGSQQVVFYVPKGAGRIYFPCFYRDPETRFGDVGTVEVRD